ncbi:hypothetical protein K438DRAFT_1771056 [Mycena galopus ATCC 62051]|nr:hypothetical protein K438DRAFT_1771056 [Mycena galopus ATCC 62051]
MERQMKDELEESGSGLEEFFAGRVDEYNPVRNQTMNEKPLPKFQRRCRHLREPETEPSEGDSQSSESSLDEYDSDGNIVHGAGTEADEREYWRILVQSDE